MAFKQLTPSFSVARQPTDTDIARAAAEGFKSIIDNRPDGEDAGQPDAATMAQVAARHGMQFEHIPVAPGTADDRDVAKMAIALNTLDKPILAYCRTGMRAATLWALAHSRNAEPDAILAATAAGGFDLSALKPRLQGIVTNDREAPGKKAQTLFDVVIVGGGSAGIATAASLLKRKATLSIAVIEPAVEHYYQPGWTMVGAGVFTPEQTRHTMAETMPDPVTWIRQAAASFEPETNEVVLDDGSSVVYRVLVAAPGLKLDWQAIPGLSEALGNNGVTSNYRYDLAPYTYDLVRQVKAGRALFTQPAMPIKCAGAPQKAMYLSCDVWSERNILRDIDVEFHNAGAVLFGVATYVPALMKYVRRYGIDLKLESKLVAVDGPRKVATFESKGADGAIARIERGFDMLHAVPPQVAPDFVRASPLANAAGFVEVDQATLRHVRYPNIYALGDACGTTNAKTTAAARKQAPVVAVNVLSTLKGGEPIADYDGYGSCPLTVERGKVILAEFGYGGKLLPSFPSWLLDGTRPSRAAWFLKSRMLPVIYWHGMLKGHEWMAAPHMIDGPGS
jgi:sulfide:quinone oxidoreductase